MRPVQETSPHPALHAPLRRLVNIEADEVGATLLSFAYFFTLLCGYYIIRPIRDEMAILGGIENIQWLFLAVFLSMLALVPLFGWLTSRLPRARFLPIAYGFFALNLVGFYLLFRQETVPLAAARGFYVWVSVFNLFVVSVFWSFMTDIFSDAQARRLFPFIAAGGTCGALLGPTLTALLVEPLGMHNLMLMSAGCLLLAIAIIVRLGRRHVSTTSATGNSSVSMGGGVWDGIRLVLGSRYLLGVCALILLYTMLSTFLYFQQAQILEGAFDDSRDRTAVFAYIDILVNALTLGCQVFITGRLVRGLGLAWTLALIPLALVVGFALLAAAPVVATIVTIQALRRAGTYAVMKPAREMLYVVLPREQKYKAKNFIDTSVYRAGDTISAWLYAGLQGLGLGISAIALLAMGAAGLFATVSYRMGRANQQLRGRAPDSLNEESRNDHQ